LEKVSLENSLPVNYFGKSEFGEYFTGEIWLDRYGYGHFSREMPFEGEKASPGRRTQPESVK
jgi:hypothetical protein